MIVSFKDKATAEIFEGRRARGVPSDLFSAARRRLAMLDAAPTLESLRVPPGNRLHALKDDRAGEHAIRINDQFRICFRWTEAGPSDVEIVDYH